MVSEERIKALMGSQYLYQKMGKKTLVLTMILPSGFEITVSSACVKPEDYDLQIGKNICLKKVEDKVWELEGYLEQYSGE